MSLQTQIPSPLCLLGLILCPVSPFSHPSPHPLGVFQLLEREEGAWGPWPGIPCLLSPSPAPLLASAPLQLDSNPLEAAANSAESLNLQGLHKLAFRAKCSPEKEELGSGVGVGQGCKAQHNCCSLFPNASPSCRNNPAEPSQEGRGGLWGPCRVS